MINVPNVEQAVRERYAAGAQRTETALCCQSTIICNIWPFYHRKSSKKTMGVETLPNIFSPEKLYLISDQEPGRSVTSLRKSWARPAV
jgi:hypothetical protein